MKTQPPNAQANASEHTGDENTYRVVGISRTAPRITRAEAMATWVVPTLYEQVERPKTKRVTREQQLTGILLRDAHAKRFSK